MLEKQFVLHCAPTMASLKTASLFAYEYADRQELYDCLMAWNARFRQKGIRLLTLKDDGSRALIYMYRPDRLEKDLGQPEAADFLRRRGYPDTSPEGALKTLISRLSVSSGFPHEIGVFLGYPLGDVIGFINCGGKNCECCGYWKVYCDPEKAEETFRRIRKCNKVYYRLFTGGRSVMQLTVNG